MYCIGHDVVFPDRKERALEMARERMEERGNLSDAQIDQGIEFTKKFFFPFVIGAILFGYRNIWRNRFFDRSGYC